MTKYRIHVTRMNYLLCNTSPSIYERLTVITVYDIIFPCIHLLNIIHLISFLPIVNLLGNMPFLFVTWFIFIPFKKK